MRRILLILSTSRYARASVRHALDEAKASLTDGKVLLRVLYIIETDELKKVRESVGGQGFLGLGPTDDVVDTLARQHHRTARRRISEARKKARGLEGLELEVLEVEGSYATQAQKEATTGDWDMVFMTRADTPFISRFLFGSETDRVARLVRGEGTDVTIDLGGTDPA